MIKVIVYLAIITAAIAAAMIFWPEVQGAFSYLVSLLPAMGGSDVLWLIGGLFGILSVAGLLIFIAVVLYKLAASRTSAIPATPAPPPAAKKKMSWWAKTILIVLAVPLIAAAGAAIYHFVVVGGHLPTSWLAWLTGITLPSAIMVANVAIAIFITACFAGMIYKLVEGKWGPAIALFVLMGFGPAVYIYVLEQFWRPTTTTVATAPPRTTASPITVTTLPGDAQCVGTLPARTIGSSWTVVNPSGRCTVEFTIEPGKCIEFKNAFNQVVGRPFCKPTSGPAVAPLLYPKNIESIRAFNSGSAQVIVGLFTPPR